MFGTREKGNRKRGSILLKNSLLLFTLSLLPFSLAYADLPDYPVYVQKIANPNDYDLFANAGWDGNWYVGFNTLWVKKLPPVPPGNYIRAYIGVKLGRMKTQPIPGKRIWDKQPIPGSIYAAISSTHTWTREQSFFIADSSEIPLEGDPENALDGVGESEWFWGDVPLRQINFAGDNFVAVWSPTPAFVNVSSSPILAAGWGGKEQDNWLNSTIHGVPPVTPSATVGTPISYFQPAIALKLIPRGVTHPMIVRLNSFQASTPDHPKPIVSVDVAGSSIERVWLEYFNNHAQEPNPHGIPSMNQTWRPVGRPVWKAPYVLSIDQSLLPPGKVQLRVVAANIWEEEAATEPFTVEVSTTNATPSPAH